MSPPHRSPTSPPSSQPSSPTSSEAARAVPFDVSFAAEEEAVELHRFLCVIAQPVLHAPIDPADSMAGVIDVINNGVAIVARLNGHIVGSLGIVKPVWWFNHAHGFMTDRWFFTYPQFRQAGVGAAMLAEADAIGKSAGLPVIINGHQKRRGNGISFTHPLVLGADGPREMH